MSQLGDGARVYVCALFLLIGACGDDPPAGPTASDATVDATTIDAGFDAGPSLPPYCPAVRATPAPGRCDPPTTGLDAGPAADAGPTTAELTIAVMRGRTLFDAANPSLDAQGRLVLLVYDEDPYCDTCDETPAAVFDQDGVALDSAAPFDVTLTVPAGPLWLFAWVDDDGDTAAGGPRHLDVGDLVTPVPQVALACTDTVAPLVLDRRLGSLRGRLSIDDTLSPADTRGDVWLILYPPGPITLASVPLGGTILRDVDLATPIDYAIDSFVDYDGMSLEFVPAPATMQLLGILDADADGEIGELGELLALETPMTNAGISVCFDDRSLELHEDIVFNYVVD